MRACYDLLSQRPRTAYDLAQATWSNVPVTRAYLALSSILGQTDLLIADGLVREVERDDGVVAFAVSGGPA